MAAAPHGPVCTVRRAGVPPAPCVAPPGVQGADGEEATEQQGWWVPLLPVRCWKHLGWGCLRGLGPLGAARLAAAIPLLTLVPPPPPSVRVAGACRGCADLAFGICLLSPHSRLSSGKLQDLGVVEGSKLTLVPTVEAGLMVSGLFLLLPPSHSSPSIIKAPGEDVLAALRLRCPSPR